MTVLTQHTIRIAEDRLTRSQLKYLRILSCKNDQFNTVCHQANRQLHARLLDFTQYIRYKPVLQLEELITAIGFVVFMYEMFAGWTIVFLRRSMFALKWMH